MANFAKLDNNNIVLQVVVVSNDAIDSSNEEASGIAFLTNLLGYSNWKQTSITNRIRKNYAAIGMVYDEQRDAFISPKPTDGQWQLNEDTCRWEKLV